MLTFRKREIKVFDTDDFDEKTPSFGSILKVLSFVLGNLILSNRTKIVLNITGLAWQRWRRSIGWLFLLMAVFACSPDASSA
jgi:hypothetical protein